MLERHAIEEADHRIAGYVRRTPILELEPSAFDTPSRIALKLELFQHTGSFKPRGAFNRALSSAIPEAGLVAASGGNHAIAVAHVGRTLGCPVEVFVPEVASAAKIERLRESGAKVFVGGAYYADALNASRARARETGALEIHAYDQPEVVAGQGTIARELAEQVRNLDTVLVAVGGGGLIAGIAAWFRGAVKIVSVEPRTSRALDAALEAGHTVDVDVQGIAADSLGARRAGELALEMAALFVRDRVLVEDQEILAAQQLLYKQTRILAEPGGAAALAALVSKRYRPEPGERVAVIICGGNSAGSRHTE